MREDDILSFDQIRRVIADIIEYRQTRWRVLRDQNRDPAATHRLYELDKSLRYPEDGNEPKREYMRFACSVDAVLRLEASDKTSDVVVIVQDISAGGTHLSTGAHVPNGVEATLVLPAELTAGHSVRIRGSVVWSEQGHLGFMFAGVPTWDGDGDVPPV